jgi:hypothetical protein
VFTPRPAVYLLEQVPQNPPPSESGYTPSRPGFSLLHQGNFSEASGVSPRGYPSTTCYE